MRDVVARKDLSPLAAGKETRFAMPFYSPTKNDHFTKTGSGQTYIGKALKKGGRVSAGAELQAVVPSHGVALFLLERAAA